MDCAEEVAVLKQAVGPVVGGDDRLAFDILNGRMIVSTVDAVPEAAIVRAVHATGMRAEPWREGEHARAGSTLWERQGHTITTAVSGLALASGFALHAILAGSIRDALGSEGLAVAHGVPMAARVLYGLAIVAGGWFVAPKTWFAARRLRPDMNLLMTIAVIGAVSIGEWFEAATVAFLFALSLALEAWSIGRARRAIEALMDLAPPLAHLLEDGSQREVSPDRVPVGSRLLVKPGEKIPLDGLIVRGVSAVNQAPITGESVPVRKDTGSQVFAGTINGDGALEVESTRPASDTTLAHIIRMVGEASRRRATSEQWVERLARI
jgi:Cd2+/Zn2+-exporting ATPase